jgi:hypothetical protein
MLGCAEKNQQKFFADQRKINPKRLRALKDTTRLQRSKTHLMLP